MKKLLIFGAAGFVGSYLAKEFKKAGYAIFGSDKAIIKQLAGFDNYIQGDLLDKQAVEQIIYKTAPDIVINLAAISSVGLSWSIPQETIQVNVIGTLNILEAVKNDFINTKVMLIGSSEEYAPSDDPVNEFWKLDANNPYGISKMAQERFAELYRTKYGMKIYCIRAFNHTGVGQKDTFVLPSFCKQVAEIEKSGLNGIIKVGNLSVKRDFSDVRDIVHAYRLVVESNDCNTVYNVGSGRAYSLTELLNYIISLSSQQIRIEIDSNRMRPADNPIICCDNSRIKKNLGWKNKYSIRDTLKEMYQSYL